MLFEVRNLQAQSGLKCRPRPPASSSWRDKRCARSDSRVAAQTLKINAGARDAVLVAGTDAGLMLQAAVPKAALKARPGTPEFRAALRDALEGTRELVATQGVCNLSAQDHSGFDERGRVLIVVKDGNWKLLKE